MKAEGEETVIGLAEERPSAHGRKVGQEAHLGPVDQNHWYRKMATALRSAFNNSYDRVPPPCLRCTDGQIDACANMAEALVVVCLERTCKKNPWRGAPTSCEQAKGCASVKRGIVERCPTFRKYGGNHRSE